jgi:Uma2 family endonuclease
MSATEHVGLTLEDLLDLPDEDGWRRELIGGRLYVSPEPRNSHQRVIGRLWRVLLDYADAHGGDVWGPANFDPAVGEHLAPDLVALGPEWQGEVDELSVRSAPSLIVEVSSQSTRAYDLGAERAVYERQGVPEYWFVDLDHRCVRAFRLEGLSSPGSDEAAVAVAYGEPEVVARDGWLRPRGFPGLEVPVAEFLR